MHRRRLAVRRRVGGRDLDSAPYPALRYFGLQPLETPSTEQKSIVPDSVDLVDLADALKLELRRSAQDYVQNGCRGRLHVVRHAHRVLVRDLLHYSVYCYPAPAAPTGSPRLKGLLESLGSARESPERSEPVQRVVAVQPPAAWVERRAAEGP